LAVAFEHGSELGPLLDAVEDILRLLNESGVAAFPAYGTLLGAVRDGAVIGHDSDADLGYLSRFSSPVDVMRESFRLQRVLERAGHRTVRYSGGAIKVEVAEKDGLVRGVDVFAGFLHDGHLALMGELYVPFEREWLLPLGTIELEGRTLTVPAEPERLLEATYGPSWRVPDPAFSFEKTVDTERRLSNWFRGTRVHRAEWERRYSMGPFELPARMRPHPTARMLSRSEEPGTTVIDLGCGRGQDAYWLAGRGFPTYAFDFAPTGYAAIESAAAADERPVTFHVLNLLDLRHSLSWGARLSRLEGPRAILARHVLDATNIRGRRHAFYLARMALASTGGRLYADVVTGEPEEQERTGSLLYPLKPELVAEEAAAYGGRVIEVANVTTEHTGQPPVGATNARTQACRMVMEWGA
jgi:SAM-dependent methyltransferase